MVQLERQSLRGVVLDRDTVFSLVELCELCRLPAETVIEMVEEGLIDPLEEESARSWRFTADTLPRIQTALRLQHDLRINLAGVALVIDLLDEIRELRSRMKSLERQLSGF